MGDTTPPFDVPSEMTAEDWAAIAGLGQSFNGDTPPYDPYMGGGDFAGVGGYTPMTPEEQRISDQAYWDDLFGGGGADDGWSPGGPNAGDDLTPSLDTEPSALLPTSRSFLSEDNTKAELPSVTGSISDQYGDPKSPYYLGQTLPAGGFDPETGAYGPAEVKGPSGWSKFGSAVKDFLIPPTQYDKNGKPIQTSTSSSLGGMAAGAASGAASGRLDEAKLALQRDQTNASLYGTNQNATLRAGEIEMMRKRLLNAQRAKAQNILRSPNYTAAQKAEAQQTLDTLDQQLTSPLVLPKPGATTLPTQPWWEKALATAGLLGTGGDAARYSRGNR